MIILLVCILLCTTALVGIFAFFVKNTGRLRPEKGVLDLQSWRPEQDGVLSLSGEWDFYWERFPTFQEINAKAPAPDVTADIPNVWNRYKIDGKNPPGYGYATYVLQVVNAPQGQSLALRIPTFSTAYELYIDNRLISGNGRVGRDVKQSVPWYRPLTATFTPEHADFYIIVHVSNYIYSRGGMWYPLILGTPGQIQSADRAVINKDLFLMGALAVMAFYYLNIFLLRREDKSSLYYVFMCLTLALRTLVYGDYMIYKVVPFITFHAIIVIEYLTVLWFPIFAASMIGELFPEERSLKVLRVFLFYALVMTLVFLGTPIVFFTQLVYVLDIVALIIGAYPILCAARAFLKEKKYALTVLLGTLPVIESAAYDMLYQNNRIYSSVGELMPVGLFLLLLMQSFVLARRSAEAFRSVKALSQKLLKLDKIKDEFLANTSHELRTPLSGILGITEAMLKGSDGELNSRQQQNLATIAGSSRRLANLVNDILDYSKMKNGDILLHIRPIQIEGLIHTLVGVFQQLSRSKEYEVISDIPDGLPPVLADENRVVQILYNLVGNAAKFTVQGCIKISVRKMSNMLEVCVSDTGEGIPADKLTDIFKSFEQVDNSLTRRHGGTGLGLPITKQLVELQGGAIRVESHPGAGSRFYFTLPVVDPAAVPVEPIRAEREPDHLALELAAAIGEPPAVKKETAGSVQILLVDDDPVNLQAASSILRLGGYGVTAAVSGKAALAELVGRRDFSVVVLDVMMPEISGYEVCRKIREDRPGFELPVLVLTAKAATEDVVLGFEAGANDYLPKPYEPEELLARVKTLAELKASVDKAMAAETALMQAQIKPHFLFNTLNAISSFCDSDPARAQQLIDDFSSYLRRSFDFKSLESYETLDRELALVNSYVQIQKARFGEGLRVQFDIDETVNSKLPVLSLQPLVENAISHGLRKKGRSGSVVISVKRTAAGVLVAVEDDGQGIPADKLKTLLTSESGRGLGLWNIDRRLKKFYGRGLTIASVPGRGTRVSYIIPAEGEVN
ncbi:ATP-binding protein [Desulfosporosinus sp. PR]|nr:ATP-binding protein [Desulfosporosinus sp. PR]